MNLDKLKKLPNANLENTKELAEKFNHKFIIKMNYNENKFKASPNVKKNIKILSPNIYPEFNHYPLLNLFKEKFNIDKKNIFFTNGSDALLDHFPKIFGFLKPNPNIIIPSLTYARLEITCSIFDLKIKKINLTDDWNINLNETINAIEKNTTMIYLVNPNMPTGLYFSHEIIESFIKKIPKSIYIVLDEAYIEYAEGGDIQKTYEQNLMLINKFKNLIITRTFSKYYGLAAFRIGYCLSHEENIEIIRKTHQYLPVNKYSYQAATAAINDLEFYKKNYLKLEKEKEKLYKFFKKNKIEHLKSKGNFIFLYNCKFSIDHLIEFLLKKYGILIRKIKKIGIRITIGTPKENNLLLKGIKEFLNGNKI